MGLQIICRVLGVSGVWFCLLPAVLAAPPTITGELRCQPAELTLSHPRQPHSILVSGTTDDGQTVDLTAGAAFQSANERFATVDAFGWVKPISAGKTTITVRAAGKTATVPVTVVMPAAEQPVSFRHEVMPVFSKVGCNSGACHGYSLGKGGLRLSLRGGDEAEDYRSITQEFLGRRINLQNPEASLLLRKPLGEVPHRGGVRLERGDPLHETLLRWLQDGAPGDTDSALKLVSVRILPEKAILRMGTQQQLQLLAVYSDGTRRDVTRLGVFASNADTIATAEDGVVRARARGETAVVARFERLFAVCNVLVPPESTEFSPSPAPTENLIDRHVVSRLNDLKISPSELCGDAEFLRRVFIDLIGIQPKPEEVRAFLADKAPNKRAKVVEVLLQRPEFVDHWSLRWGDLLQNSRTRLGESGMKAFQEWIRKAVAENLPLDQFARQLLTSNGDAQQNPASGFYAISADADETVQRVTQVFCGVRMLCAKCHNHPFENWTQVDYYGLTSFFNQVSVAGGGGKAAKGKDASKEVQLKLTADFSVNPRTNARQPPRFLGGAEAKLDAGTDRREAYVQWLTAPENPFFARSLTNRIWSYLFHQGIIDPVDDLRSTNPPSNGPLLEALTQDFIAHKFDARHLMRTIVNSQTYQRSSRSNASNTSDTRNFARAIPRRLRAEVLVDSLVQATGVPETFPGYPAGTRAAQLPDPVLAAPARVAAGTSLLGLFGKPQRMEACECERSDESNMLQALEMINGKTILDRVARPGGRVDQLLKQKLSDPQVIEELYWWALARPPLAQEAAIGLAHFKAYGGKRAEAAQDLMWALLNSKDFLFNH